MEAEFRELYRLLLADQPPQNAAAVVWLQGDRHDRADKVLEVYKNNLAKKILITGNNILIGQDTRLGENNISLSNMKDYLLKNGVITEDIIIDDGALNTKEQAIHVVDLAKRSGWSEIILVSSAYNQPRAWLTFLRQAAIAEYKLTIYNQTFAMASDEIPGGRQETVAELCLSEIKKINKYQSDLLPLAAGINYFKIQRKL